MKLLQGIGTACGKMQRSNVFLKTWKQRDFHLKSCLLQENKFEEKPMWFKQFKLKQAEFQKDDGLPTFLKRGLPDKILYNVTLGLIFLGCFFSFKILINLDNPNK